MFWEIVSPEGESMGIFEDEAEAWACFGGVEDGTTLVAYSDGDSLEDVRVIGEWEAVDESIVQTGGFFYTVEANRRDEHRYTLQFCDSIQKAWWVASQLNRLMAGEVYYTVGVW